MSLSQQVIIKPHRGPPLLNLGERPPCPKCGSRHIVNHGVWWECLDCDKTFARDKAFIRKDYLDRPPCPRCGSRRIWKTALKWRCGDCGRCFQKHHISGRRLREETKQLSDKGLRKCSTCGEIKSIDGFFNRYPSGLESFCKKCKSISTIKSRLKLKIEVMTHYCNGVPKCQCEYGCNETNIRFLTMDHINNDAHKEKYWSYGNNLLNRLKREGYPLVYRVLCFNCNCGRGFNNGICPHKEGKI